MRPLIRTGVLSIAILGLIAPLTQARADVPETIKIGVTAPLSGPGAQSGLSLQTGMKLAADIANEKGGIQVGGKRAKVEVVFEDDQSNPAAGVNAALKLLTQEKVNFLIGDAFRSDVTLAVMDLAPQFNVTIMSGEPVAASISQKIAKDPKKYANFWKGNWSSDSYAGAIYESVMDLVKAGKIDPKNKTVAFVSEDTEYGRTISELTGQAFEKAGWKQLDIETVPLGTSDLYPQLNKIKAMNPALVMGTFTSTESGSALVKQFHELGMNATLAGIYFPNRPDFMKAAGKSADGLLWATLLYDPIHNREQAKFAAFAEQRLHQKPNYDIVAGYDIMSVALEAISKAGSLDAAAVDKAMASMNYKSVLGRYAFDSANHTVKVGANYIPVPVAQVINGESYVIWPGTVATHAFEPQTWAKGAK